MAKISAKQELFVDEYLIDLNATQAAIRAGYSPKTAEQQGSRLLSNVKVKGRVAEKMAERSKRCGINQDRVLQELARIAFVNPADVINMSDASIKDEAWESITPQMACLAFRHASLYSSLPQKRLDQIHLWDRLMAQSFASRLSCREDMPQLHLRFRMHLQKTCLFYSRPTNQI